MRRPRIAPRQGRLDDLASPLHQVTFCAVDLETTGGSARQDEIVEIGAVLSRGGEPLGTFQTFVQPRGELPVDIQVLTGIRPSMLDSAPPLPAVLPAFLEFAQGSVFVAHNARFDHSFLAQACRALDYDDPEFQVVDTVKLARRLLRGEVRNNQLSTLATFFRTTHKPCHRAFPDAAACLEVLYGLLERAAAYGVTTLPDLLELQYASSSPHFEKVRLARRLPRSRGVYMFANARREIVYIGKATDLRARVRSYFVSDERKRIGDLLAEIADVRVLPCDTDVEARALEARLIEHHAPRHNRRGVVRRPRSWLRLSMKGRHPRFAVTSSPRPDGTPLIGPFPSAARARAAGETLASVFGVRTCSLALSDGRPRTPCALYELGCCRGPCTEGPRDVRSHDDAVAAMVADLHRGLEVARALVLADLARLADQQRFEEAAARRAAYDDLARVVAQAGRLHALAGAGRVELTTKDGPVTFVSGRLGGAWAPASPPPPDALGPLAVTGSDLEERRAVAGWMERATGVVLISAERPLAYPWPRPRELAEGLGLDTLDS